ncbi:MAG: hypothetical protein E1N59_1593 [Puniceicoccaceae bacterium 5H]|nr:MAG: hypothetical protein E1N59_1593 [Puniceicoccaceae bacterium 5H]
MFKPLYLCSLLALPLAAAPSPERAALDDARSTIKQWVGVEDTLSRESAAWQRKQTLLNDLLGVSEQRLAQLDATLQETEGDLSTAEQARAELLDQQDALEQQADLVRRALATLEADLRALQPHLPPPLQEELARDFQRLPGAEAETSLGLGERMQTVVNLIERIRAFDDTVRVHEAVQTLPGQDRPAAVRTLYLGLGQAYYIAPEDAGFGRMTRDGWQWQSQPELADAIAAAMEIVDGTSDDLDFIALPVNLTATEADR